MSQKIRIKLKSYDHTLVEKSAEKIDKDLLLRIITAVMDGTYDTDEELKIEIIHAIE